MEQKQINICIRIEIIAELAPTPYAVLCIERVLAEEELQFV
jgi:hypothetical protein